jgi:hypothetical protein
VFNKPLHSNSRLSWLHYSGFQASWHIAPFLMLFVPNSLLAYHCSFFPVGSARDVFLWVGLSCRGDYSSTVTTAPSLSALVPSVSLIRFRSIQVYKHQHFLSFFIPTVGAKLSRVAGAPTSPALLMLIVRVGSSTVSEGSTPSQWPVLDFLWHDVTSGFLLRDPHADDLMRGLLRVL